MLKLYKYQLPFKQPFILSGQQFHNREGIILSYKEGDMLAFGEAAPLPGFSTETAEQVESVLNLNRDALDEALKNDTATELLYALDQVHNFPSLSFAIDTLIHDLESKKRNLSFSEYLFGENNLQPVKANGIISISDEKSTLAQVQEFILNGFDVLKIKVGVNFKKEKRILKQIIKQFPKIKFRIDANQSWDVQEAISNLKELEDLPIEYCEQPVPENNTEGLATIRTSTSIPIAADESARTKLDAQNLIAAKAVDILILKPTLLGSFKNIFVTKELAETHNIGITFTTAMESAVARSCIAHLAAGLSVKKKNNYHGLATGNLFNYDITHSAWMNGCEINFPDDAGLGIKLDLLKMKEL